MTINVSGYTVGANQPLKNARILWNMVAGTISGNGTNVAFAANDYTAQRWEPSVGYNDWWITTAADEQVDCLFIDGHNLAGKTISVQTAAIIGGAVTARATLVVPDNLPIMVLFNSATGLPITIRRIFLSIPSATADTAIAIIRAGLTLQMPIPIYGGHKVLTRNRVTEGQQLFSETAQWLGRTVKRKAFVSIYAWEYLKSDWYRANFEPFALTLPGKPFAIAGNPARMTDDVGWCWANGDVEPTKMGVLNYEAVTLNVTGFAG